MTRLEKCELLKSKGYTYDPDTGKIFGIHGKEITNKNEAGYITISTTILKGKLKGQHFAWFMTYGNVDFEILDHINRDKSDNRICNLRISDYKKNAYNRDTKGYCLDGNKWKSQIMLNGKNIHLGIFDTKEEARKAYLEAKEKYHII